MNELTTRNLQTIELSLASHILNAAREVWEIGHDLTDAKLLVPHGAWGNWLKDHANCSQSTAENYMRIYREVPSDSIMLTMGSTKVLALLDAPKETRQELLDTGRAEDMSAAEIRRLTRETERLSRELSEERNRPAEKVIVKPDDYDAVKANNLRLTEMHDRMADAVANAEAKLKEAQERAREAEEYAADMEEETKSVRAELRRAECAGAERRESFEGMSTERFLKASRAMLAELVTAPSNSAWLASLTRTEVSELTSSVTTLMNWGRSVIRAIETRDIVGGDLDG